jgi:hypothetical protein
MQTFLPYADFNESVKVLDYRRLGKQRVEAMQILNVLDSVSPSMGWRNHPAVKMWSGYTVALMQYTNVCITEWIVRGYKNTMKLYPITDAVVYPWWLGNDTFHRAMRSRLIVKDPIYYIPIFGKDDIAYNDGKYFWPDNENMVFRVI